MRRFSSILIISGKVLVLSSLIAVSLIFWPVISLEISYVISGPGKGAVSKEKVSGQDTILPRDTEFGIVIPKIRANAKVIPNVNPFEEKDYQVALTKGVAHATGTAKPGEEGNIFLFSHSSVDFYEAARYNSIFYLLNKMEKDDEIYVFYKGEEYKYRVKNKKIVGAKDVSYLSQRSNTEQLTLMTCWPPGTTLKRLLVIAEVTKE